MKLLVSIIFLLTCINCCAGITRKETDGYIRYEQAYHDTKLYIFWYKDTDLYSCTHWKFFADEWYHWNLEKYLPQIYESLKQKYEDGETKIKKSRR